MEENIKLEEDDVDICDIILTYAESKAITDYYRKKFAKGSPAYNNILKKAKETTEKIKMYNSKEK